ncbi:hypothetical protein BEN44_20180 [Leptospira interrogans serovar Ricardi]|nr:hypothetical protein [Leptospira interrogans serovar Ricardi]
MRKLYLLLILLLKCRGEDLGFKKDCGPLIESTLTTVCLSIINNSKTNSVDADFYMNICLLRLIDAQNCE